MSGPAQFRLLRMVLLFCAVAWGVSVYGVFASWDGAADALRGLGAGEIAYDPMLDYWLRMAAGAFALVGVGYLTVAVHPRKYAVTLHWFGWLMILEGGVLLVHGVRLGLPPFPFYGDLTACFGGGGAILLLRKCASSG